MSLFVILGCFIVDFKMYIDLLVLSHSNKYLAAFHILNPDSSTLSHQVCSECSWEALLLN